MLIGLIAVWLQGFPIVESRIVSMSYYIMRILCAFICMHEISQKTEISIGPLLIENRNNPYEPHSCSGLKISGWIRIKNISFLAVTRGVAVIVRYIMEWAMTVFFFKYFLYSFGIKVVCKKGLNQITSVLTHSYSIHFSFEIYQLRKFNIYNNQSHNKYNTSPAPLIRNNDNQFVSL
jgi:hypothetical protein